jgi:hypothetical protein
VFGMQYIVGTVRGSGDPRGMLLVTRELASIPAGVSSNSRGAAKPCQNLRTAPRQMRVPRTVTVVSIYGEVGGRQRTSANAGSSDRSMPCSISSVNKGDDCFSSSLMIRFRSSTEYLRVWVCGGGGGIKIQRQYLRVAWGWQRLWFAQQHGPGLRQRACSGITRLVVVQQCDPRGRGAAV